MWQAYRAGKRAAWLPAEDWEARLREPLDTVRSRLNIPAPEQYRAVLAALPVAA
jgi:ubiquinone biosynthesis protein COQ4